MNKHIAGVLLGLGTCTFASAAEITVQNDSLTGFGTAVVVFGFVPGEKVASWLTSPCTGNLRAVQVFWRSQTGTSIAVQHSAIEILRSGTFPDPGALALSIDGPIMNDNALNEFRYLDENQTLPVSVPVTANETVVVAFKFGEAPAPASDPSVTRDTDGITAGRNALLADIGGGNFVWFNASTLGVTGDWVIRAVIDCSAAPQEADVGVALLATPSQYVAGQPLAYTIVIDNAGPVASPNTTIVDVFPASFSSPTWTCAASGGATCTASGSGNITQFVALPVGGAVTYTVNGSVPIATSGPISNSVTAVVGGSVTDPIQADNSATLVTESATGPFVFGDGFEN